MAERPILFSGPMVRAILDGRKTVTRRVVRGEVVRHPFVPGALVLTASNGKQFWMNSQESHPVHVSKACPHGVVGDRLWVREIDALPDPARSLRGWVGRHQRRGLVGGEPLGLARGIQEDDVTTHHPDARSCAPARGLRELLAYVRETRRMTRRSATELLAHQDARIAGYEAQLSANPTCPTCRAEMAREKDGAA